MSDVNANIKVSIDSSQALSELKSLQRQISLFHSNIAKSSAQAALAQKTLQTDLLNAINATGRFSAEMRTIKTSTEAFTNSLEKNKFSIRQYFRYAGASTKTFGKLFRSEFDTISQVAEDRVKKMQTQYIKMGRDAKGAMQAIAITPKSLNLSDMQTQLQITAQKQQLFNQLLKQGSTNLLNFGKNTQWAGRQLMVGFTLPLAALGTVASKTFMDMETAAIKFRKVYGDLFTPTAERDQALQNIQELGSIFTKYGIAVSDTVNLAADAAAAGFQGLDLQRQVTEATRLQVLGQIDQQKALETTISLQNAFKLSNEDLSDSINFLNAVENQTVTSLDDITTAIPKVAPVIMQLGGNVKDLAFFLTAMKEGGVNASEGANALKSGLASLINPTDKASAMLERMGISITKIVEANKGDLKNTVIDFARALDTLDPLTRARAIEQLFGKFQFARLSTLFDNVTTSGNQASRVLDLANASAADLAKTAESELGMTAESSMTKFRKAVEDLKVAVIPVGQTFLEAITPILETISGILEKFKDMSSGAKRAITILVTVVGGLGPVLLMTFGLLANGLANILKLFGMLRGGYLKLGSQTNILGQQTQYLTNEEIEAAAVASSLDQAHSRLTQTFNVEAEALNRLRMAYANTMSVAQRFAMNNPGMMFNNKMKGYAKGGEVFMVPGSGNGDTVPAMLTPGEIVVPKKQSQKYLGLLNGIIADNIPGYQEGGNIGRVTGGRFVQQSYSSLAMMGPGNTVRGAGIDLSWIKNSNIAGASFAASIKAAAMEAQGIRQTSKNYNNFWQGLNPVLDEIFNIYKSGITPDVKSIDEVSSKQYPIITQHIKDLEMNSRITAEQAEQMSIAMRKLLSPLESDKTQKSIQRIELGLDQAGQTIIKRVGNERIGKTSKAKVRSAFSREMQQRGLSTAGLSALTYAHLSASSQALTYVDPKVSGRNTAAERSVAERLAKGQAFKEGEVVAQAAIQGAVRGAQVASPSKKTISVGEDIARGLEVGMKNREDDVAMAGSRLASSAVSGTQSEKAMRSRITTYGTTGPIDPISKSIRRQNEKRLSEIQASVARPASFITQNAGRNVTDSLTKMNNNLRGASFALMSVGAAGSFAGGKVGELSQQIMKYSGLLFGLMTITELLTKESTLLAFAKRKEIASSYAAGLASKGGIFAKAGPIGAFMRAGAYVTRFLGPVGLATTALFGTYKIVQMVNAAKERERLAIEGLGDAATLSGDKLKTLGDLFGVVSMPTPFESTGPRVRVSGVDRAEIERVKASEDFQKTFAKDIKTLSGASNAEAGLVFDALAVQLRGKGYAKENINAIVRALQEEAGKTAVRFEFDRIDLSTAKGMAQLRSTVNDLSAELGIEFSRGYGAATYEGVFIKTRETLSKDLKKSINTTSKAVLGMINGISGQFENGVINATQFGEAFDFISQKISAMPEPQALLLMKNLVKGLPEEFRKTALEIKNTADQMLLLKAQALGVAISAQIIQAMTIMNNPNASGFAKIGANKTIEAFKKQIEDAMKLTEDFAKKAGTVTGELGDKGKENALQALIRQTKELRVQTRVYKELRQAGIDAALAQEMAANVDLAKLLNKTKFVGDNWKKALEAIKAYDKAQKDFEKAQAVGGGVGDYQMYLFDRAEKFIALQEQLIDMQYKGQIKAIDDQLETLNDQLDTVKEQEDAINKKFDTQVKALTTIKNLNDAIAAQEKQRLTIADALSRGDISAAAVAMQEARAQQASASMEAAQQGLTAGRESAIAALGRENIQKQIDALNKQKDVIEKTIEKQKESITYFGMTAEQIRDAARALDLAKDAGMDINNPTFLNNLLKGATGDASALKSVMVSLQEEARKLFEELQKLRMTFLTTGGGAGGVGVGPGVLGGGTGTTGAAAAYGYTNIAAYQDYRRGERMYGGFVKKYAAGGMVAGRGMIDKVPSLLTPGEYVVNKNASKRFAPLLQSINESKYPNSLSLGGTSPMIAGISNKSVNNNNTAVYNYSLSVNAGSSASPDDIARTVVAQIRNMDAQRLRGNKY